MSSKSTLLNETTCQYFSLFYDRLYNNLKLEKFYKLFFGLNI